jgi:hypothetical protein
VGQAPSLRAGVVLCRLGLTHTKGEPPMKILLGVVIALVLLSAQNAAGGTIGCKVTVDGEVVAENKSRGRFAVVSCDGTLN